MFSHVDTEEMSLRPTWKPSQSLGEQDVPFVVTMQTGQNKQTGCKRQMAHNTDGLIWQTPVIDMQEGNAAWRIWCCISPLLSLWCILRRTGLSKLPQYCLSALFFCSLPQSVEALDYCFPVLHKFDGGKLGLTFQGTCASLHVVIIGKNICLITSVIIALNMHWTWHCCSFAPFNLVTEVRLYFAATGHSHSHW